MAEEMILDTATEVEPIETDAGAELEVSDGQETPVEGAEQGTQDAEADQPASAVWREVKDLLKNKPSLYRAVKTAIHAQERLREKLPDGLETAVKRLEAVNQLDDDPEDPDYVAGSRTFEEVISNTMAERGFWRDFDNAFQAGDGRVVKQMIEANPTSFQKLIPEAMDHYQQLNPDGYSAYICKSVDSYLVQQKIPLQIEILDMLLPETSNDPGTQRVIAAFKAIKDTISTIQNVAKNPIEPKQVAGGQAAPQNGTQPANSVDQELALRHDAWLPEIRQRSEAYAVNEALKIAGKTRFTPAEVGKIKNFVRNEVGIRTKADDAFQRKIKGLLKANNKAAYAMTVESKHKTIIQEAVKRIVPQVIGERKGTKTAAAQQTGQKPAQAAAAARPGDEQFELIAGPPRTLGMKVDLKRTSNAMLASDRAYIEGRSKPVRWRRK